MKILIVKTSSLGDILHTLPSLDLIKRQYPDAEIDWVAERAGVPLAKNQPTVRRVIEIDSKTWRKAPVSCWSSIRAAIQELRKESYDYIFDLQGNVKSGLLTLLARGKHKVGFSWKSVTEWPNLLSTTLRFTPPEGQNIRDDLSYLIQKGMNLPIQDSSPSQHKAQIPRGARILVCPGSAWDNKKVSFHALSGFLELIHEKYDASFLFAWGSESEKKEVQKLCTFFSCCSEVLDRLPFSGLQKVMEEVDLVITMDSLPLHLAGLTSTPTFAVFGPSLAEKYAPNGSHNICYQGECPYGKTFVKRCSKLRTCSTGACIKHLGATTLFAYFERKFTCREIEFKPR